MTELDMSGSSGLGDRIAEIEGVLDPPHLTSCEIPLGSRCSVFALEPGIRQATVRPGTGAVREPAELR
jgi:hypothetical protein